MLAAQSRSSECGATYLWNLQVGHLAIAVLTRYPAISERLYTTARHLGLLQNILSPFANARTSSAL